MTDKKKILEEVTQQSEYLAQGAYEVESSSNVRTVTELQEQLLYENFILLQDILGGFEKDEVTELLKDLEPHQRARQIDSDPNMQLMLNEAYAEGQRIVMNKLTKDEQFSTNLTGRSIAATDNMIFQYYKDMVGMERNYVEDLLIKQDVRQKREQLYNKFKEIYPMKQIEEFMDEDKYYLIQENLNKEARYSVFQQYSEAVKRDLNFNVEFDPKSNSPQEMIEFVAGITFLDEQGEEEKKNFIDKANKHTLKYNSVIKTVEDVNSLEKQIMSAPQNIQRSAQIQQMLNEVNSKYNFQTKEQKDYHEQLLVGKYLIEGIFKPIKNNGDFGQVVKSLFDDNTLGMYDVINLASNANIFLKSQVIDMDHHTTNSFREQNGMKKTTPYIIPEFWRDEISPTITNYEQFRKFFDPAIQMYRKIVPQLLNQQDAYKMVSQRGTQRKLQDYTIYTDGDQIYDSYVKFLSEIDMKIPQTRQSIKDIGQIVDQIEPLGGVINKSLNDLILQQNSFEEEEKKEDKPYTMFDDEQEELNFVIGTNADDLQKSTDKYVQNNLERDQWVQEVVNLSFKQEQIRQKNAFLQQDDKEGDLTMNQSFINVKSKIPLKPVQNTSDFRDRPIQNLNRSKDRGDKQKNKLDLTMIDEGKREKSFFRQNVNDQSSMNMSFVRFLKQSDSPRQSNDRNDNMMIQPSQQVDQRQFNPSANNQSFGDGLSFIAGAEQIRDQRRNNIITEQNSQKILESQKVAATMSNQLAEHKQYVLNILSQAPYPQNIKDQVLPLAQKINDESDPKAIKHYVAAIDEIVQKDLKQSSERFQEVKKISEELFIKSSKNQSIYDTTQVNQRDLFRKLETTFPNQIDNQAFDGSSFDQKILMIQTANTQIAHDLEVKKKLYAKINDEMSTLSRYTDQYSQKVSNFKNDRKLFLAAAVKSGINVDDIPDEDSPIQEQLDFYERKKEVVKNQVDYQENLIEYGVRVRKQLDSLIQASEKEFGQMNKYLRDVKFKLQQYGVKNFEIIDKLLGLDVKDPTYASQFKQLVQKLNVELDEENEKVREISQSKTMVEQLLLMSQRLSQNAVEVKENWTNRFTAFKDATQKYNQVIDQITTNVQERDDLKIKEPVEGMSAEQYRDMVADYNEKISKFATKKSILFSTGEQAQKTLQVVRGAVDDILRATHDQERNILKAKEVLSGIDYPNKANIDQINTIQDFDAEINKIQNGRKKILDDITFEKNRLFQARQDIQKYEEQKRKLEIKQKELEDVANKNESIKLQISGNQRFNQVQEDQNLRFLSLMNKMTIASPQQQKEIIQRNPSLVNDAILKVNNILDANQNQIFLTIRDLGKSFVDPKDQEFFTQSAEYTNTYKKLLDLRAKFALQGQTNKYDLVRSFSTKVEQNIENTLTQFDRLNIQMGYYTQSLMTSDISLGLKQELAEQRQKIFKVSQLNRQNMAILLQQGIMFDEFLDSVTIMDQTPSGRRQLLQHLSPMSTESDISSELQLLNEQMANKMIAYQNTVDYNINEFDELKRWGDSTLIPKMGKIKDKLKSLSSREQGIQQMEVISQLSQDLAKKTIQRVKGKSDEKAKMDYEIDLYTHRLSDVFQHMLFSYGAGIFNGVPTQNLQPGGQLQQEAMALFENIQSNNLIDRQQLRNSVGQTVEQISRTFGPDLVRSMSEKFGHNVKDMVEGMSEEFMGKAFRKAFDPNIQIEKDMLSQQPFMINKAGGFKGKQREMFMENAQYFENYKKTYDEFQQRLKPDAKSGQIPQPVAPSKQEMLKRSTQNTIKVLGYNDMPLAAQVLGKRPASIYDSSVPVNSYDTTRKILSAEVDPRKLEEYKFRIDKQKEAIKENIQSLGAGVNSINPENVVNAQKAIRSDFAAIYLPKILEDRDPQNRIQYQEADYTKWSKQGLGFYYGDYVTHGAKVFSLLFAPIQAKMDNMQPLSINDLTYLQAFRQEYEQAEFNIKHDDFVKYFSDHIQQKQQAQMTKQMLQKSKDTAKGRGEEHMTRTKQLMEAKIEEVLQYGTSYDEAQLMMLQDYDQLVVQQEIKLGGFGQMNNMIQKFSSDMERMMLDTLQKNGLDNVPRQMQERQMKMVAQAGHAIRSGQIPPSAYQKQQNNPGQATPQFGDMKQYALQRTIREEAPNQAQQESEQNDSQGGVLSKKAMKAVQTLNKISLDDLRFISKLKKDEQGKLKFVEGDQMRELTDDEKMRAAKILISIVMVLMRAYMQDLSETEYQNKKKQLQDKHLKKPGFKDVSDISRLIENIIKKVKE